MYRNLSLLEIISADVRLQKADDATDTLEAMEQGHIPYDAVVWNAAEQYLADCRTWAMQKAELYGLTNQQSSAFGLM